MAEEEELKSMILSFRVSELHMLLGFAGRNKTGRKNELQARAIELLQLGSYPVKLKIKNLYKSIQQNPQPTVGLPGISRPPEIEKSYISEKSETGSYSELQHSSGRQFSAFSQHSPPQKSAPIYPGLYHQQYLNPIQASSSSNYPIHPDVKLKKLPFYEISAELLKPSSLVPQGNQRQQERSFTFHLTPQQANAIGLSRDLRPGSKVEFSIQGQLRFCLLETTSEQEDCFPPGVMLKVNHKPCQLPNPIPTNKPGVEPKRPPRPINITPYMKISPTVGNRIDIQWSMDYTRGYVVAVYLVNKKTSEDLLNRLKAKGVRGADYTRGMIKDKLNEDADSEIATTSLRVSLVCPLGKMRMVTPCRASTCQHLQCFDASLYLQMNERKPTWMCPVCDKPALYDKLVIDGYFQEVLSSGRLPPDGNEIQLHSDGSWSTHVVKKEQSRVIDQTEATPVKVEPKVETLDIDAEEIEVSPQPSATASSTNKEDTTNKRRVEEVDLTLSDSDDEPLAPRKKMPRLRSFGSYGDKSASSPNGGNSVSSSGRNSPSLIILDSDSPASTPIPTPASTPPPTRTPTPTITAATAEENLVQPAFNENSVPYLSPQPHFLDVEADSNFSTF